MALSAIEEGINVFPYSLSLRERHVETLIEDMHDMEAGWSALNQLLVHRTTARAFHLLIAYRWARNSPIAS
ncbi:hypothetical protein [Rhizobium laguerreae]|uniref:hypothetical protein n=1 Tax=Rhizobium laguerreae TaxID=1076926 RepID=UPI0031B9F05C